MITTPMMNAFTFPVWKTDRRGVVTQGNVLAPACGTQIFEGSPPREKNGIYRGVPYRRKHNVFYFHDVKGGFLCMEYPTLDQIPYLFGERLAWVTRAFDDAWVVYDRLFAFSAYSELAWLGLWENGNPFPSIECFLNDSELLLSPSEMEALFLSLCQICTPDIKLQSESNSYASLNPETIVDCYLLLCATQLLVRRFHHIASSEIILNNTIEQFEINLRYTIAEGNRPLLSEALSALRDETEMWNRSVMLRFHEDEDLLLLQILYRKPYCPRVLRHRHTKINDPLTHRFIGTLILIAIGVIGFDTERERIFPRSGNASEICADSPF